ncbi:hypothetical protein AAHT65_07720 [Bacillus atrophaeus]|uniref:hypothetical protein n=1 Tax=Bacillus atrophaeus TaxID=1452 RepID=UPI0031BA6CBE
MAYEEKTDWLPDDPINEDDVNRWEKGIKDAHADLAAHKIDMNNPHKTSKGQVGLGNVDNIQQAAKKDFDNHVEDNERHISKAERENWDGKETPDGARQKANQALDEAMKYVDYNITNEKLICIRDGDERAIVDARTPGTEYPEGITFMGIYEANTTGYPLSYGFVKNENLNKWRFAQYFYGNADSTNGKNHMTGIWVRHWWDSSGWTKWEKISGFVHANIGVSDVQYLKQIDHTKIAFNRKIKDSHNAFDTKNNRFVAPNDGVYLVGVGLYMINYAMYINFHLKVYLNGKEYKTLDHYRGYFDNGKEMNLGLNGTATIPMNKGDYLEIFCYCNYGGDETVKRGITDKNEVYNYFDIQEIGGLNYPRV